MVLGILFLQVNLKKKTILAACSHKVIYYKQVLISHEIHSIIAKITISDKFLLKRNLFQQIYKKYFKNYYIFQTFGNLAGN